MKREWDTPTKKRSGAPKSNANARDKADDTDIKLEHINAQIFVGPGPDVLELILETYTCL